MEATKTLVEFVAGASASDISAAIRERAIPPIIDSLGVMLAGVGSEAGATVTDYARAVAPGGGPCWAVPLPAGAPAETAALVNATLGHALDFDDALPGSGHLAVPVLATILATAEASATPLDGNRLIEAFVIGFEVAAKVGKAFGVQHYRKGWHTTVTGGTWGTTAAAARILELDAPQVANAFGLAGSLTGGLLRNFGTMTKPLHSGLAARNGVMAAHMSLLGISAAPDILDGPGGVLDLYGAEEARPEVFGELGAPWSLVEPGTALKRYPCCYAAARPIDGVLHLRAEHGVNVEDVDEIRCVVPRTGLYPMIHRDPSTGLNAKFSMEYVLAAALLDGRVGLSSFTDEAVQRPSVRELMRRVTTSEDPNLRPEDPEARRSSPATGGWVEVTLHLHDGRSPSTTVHHPLGSPRNPLSGADMDAKLTDCALAGGFDPTMAVSLGRQLAAPDTIDDVIGQLRAHVGHRQ